MKEIHWTEEKSKRGWGSTLEVVVDGVNGWVCANVAEMAQRARDVQISPAACRRYAEEHFSAARMAADYQKLYRACLDAPGLGSAGPRADRRALGRTSAWL